MLSFADAAPDRRPATLDLGAVSTGAGARPIFLVGAPRSATTLVRLMLDAHPRIAVPTESDFLLDVLRSNPRDLAATTEEMLTEHSFLDWGLDPDAVREAIAATRPRDPSALIRVAFGAYAAAEGKPRWADKTPAHTGHIDLLATALPDAQFIHLVRDGREVAASLASKDWTSAVGGAFWWRTLVRAAVRAGARLGPARYLQIRIEDLIADPRRELEQICTFIGEEFSAEMLDYPRRAADRVVGRERGWHRLDHLRRPPTAGLRNWRQGLSARDVARVEAICGPWLRRLGYPVERVSPGAAVSAWALRVANHVPGRAETPRHGGE